MRTERRSSSAWSRAARVTFLAIAAIALRALAGCKPITYYLEQVYKVHGNVTEAGSGDAVGSVEVIVGDYQYSELTNYYGDYEIEMPEGTWTLHFVKDDYQPYSAEATVGPGDKERVRVDVVLVKDTPYRPVRRLDYAGMSSPVGVATYEYDQEGHLITADIEGEDFHDLRRFHYVDGALAQVTTEMPEDPGLPPQVELVIQNDAGGLPISAEGDDGNEHWVFSGANGHVTSITITSTESWEQIEYDDQGRVERTESGEGPVVGQQVVEVATWEYTTEGATIVIYEPLADGTLVEVFVLKTVLNQNGLTEQVLFQDGEHWILEASYEFEEGAWNPSWLDRIDHPFLGG